MAWRSKLEQTKATRFYRRGCVILGIVCGFGGKQMMPSAGNWRTPAAMQLERQQADWRAQYERMSSPAGGKGTVRRRLERKT